MYRVVFTIYLEMICQTLRGIGARALIVRALIQSRPKLKRLEHGPTSAAEQTERLYRFGGDVLPEEEPKILRIRSSFFEGVFRSRGRLGDAVVMMMMLKVDAVFRRHFGLMLRRVNSVFPVIMHKLLSVLVFVVDIHGAGRFLFRFDE